MDRHILVPFEISIIIPPVMRKVGTHQNDIAGMKTFDMIAVELGTAAMVEIDQFDFGVVMPAIVYKWIPVLPDAEGMSRRLWDF